MMPVLTKFVRTALISGCVLEQSGPSLEAASFPEIVPIAHVEPAQTPVPDPVPSEPRVPLSRLGEPALSRPLAGEHLPIFDPWSPLTREPSRPAVDGGSWLTDPWGFRGATEVEQERHHEVRLRILGDRMRDTFTAEADPLLALWDGMRSKSDPAGTYRIRQTLTQSLWYSKAKIDLPDSNPSVDPYRLQKWRAEETLRLSLPIWEPAFVFGHFNSNADSFQWRELTAVAKTGFGVRWVPLPKGEVLVRGGPMVSYLDTNRARLQERSHMALEVLATIPLWGPFQLEYTGGAFAATVPTDQNLINQDLRIALPLSNNSEFYFGARQQFDSTSPALWNERRQVYIGIELKR